jgi:hypothetical protein
MLSEGISHGFNNQNLTPDRDTNFLFSLVYLVENVCGDHSHTFSVTDLFFVTKVEVFTEIEMEYVVFVGCRTVSCGGWIPSFRRTVLPPSSNFHVSSQNIVLKRRIAQTGRYYVFFSKCHYL